MTELQTAPPAQTREPAGAAADRAGALALTVLVRCWLRETGLPVPGPGPLAVPLPATGRHIALDVARRSPSGAHEFRTIRDGAGGPLDAHAAAALLTAEAAAAAGLPPDRAADACARVVESARRAAGYARVRAAEAGEPAELPRWLAAEQGLLSGHPWHPMTKSRDGLPDAEDAAYAPEARGRFALHWYAADPAALARGGIAGLDVPALLRELAGTGVRVPPGRVPVPAHPWQAARLAHRPDGAAALDSGALLDLGPAGPPWWATSSVRTVARPGAPVMLKLSLGLRITNSRRENRRDELALAARTADLARAGLGAALAAAHPGFALICDPGWFGVDGPEGPIGLDTVIRDQPFAPADHVACAGALVDPRPDRGRPLAADLITNMAARQGQPVYRAALDWYRRWLDAVAVPLLWLHGRYGIGLEAHLQNVLVGLDAEGVPDRGWYRDNQGWYLAAGRAAEVARILPGVGEDVPLVFDDAVVTDRVAYYLGVNHLFGVAAALAGAGLAAEEDLLRTLAGVLARHRAGSDASPVADLLLDAPTLPVKANLLTGVDGRDELDGDVATQSVYVQVPNPLREVHP